jgi:Peptidase family M1 domain
MGLLLAALVVLQQQLPAPGKPSPTGNVSPASGDTVGYWQQRVSYRIVATLDEDQAKLRARGELLYVNRSPDTLREMYVHQYLNAFRPNSKWSEVDEHEGRTRFQNLRDPDYAYERFTSSPTFDGIAVKPEYPGSPDSTVAHFALPKWLLPGDSVRVVFEWDARPSTLPRRQGRRGRTWDFAQWYPKVAVYDRAGWEPNPLVPAGEFYGEFGTYDVTMVVKNDQVLASTGVPVSCDPGWERVKKWGDVHLASGAYDTLPPSDAPQTTVPDGYRAVRFLAKDVHHFAWSASPDYRYEGGLYTRAVANPTRYKTWDSVAINVLYKPGDDTTWGGGRAVQRTEFALRWLESIWGPYAYPQMTNVHRIEGGGTEFPMMIMDGSAGQGLILHEGGHVFTYGIVANNEWRSGWMDEGLTSYQTSWAQNATPPEIVLSGVAQPPDRIKEGYRYNANFIPSRDSTNLPQIRLELLGRSEPIGTAAQDFREFGIYNEMIYDRGELMYGQLRDAIGDTAFRRFFHDYWNRWALRHVDERAMQASAVRSSGKDLGWFFQQWVHRTGLMDYELDGVSTTPSGNGKWVTRATITRRGEYRHPMPVGARTSKGWTIVRGDAMVDRQTVEITTDEQPSEVRLDPYHFTFDWDRRNDKLEKSFVGFHRARTAFDWPWLDQSDREHNLFAISPLLWLSGMGSKQSDGSIRNSDAVSVGIRARSSYLNLVDRYDFGVAGSIYAADGPGAISRLQVWARTENPYLPFFDHPLMGQRFEGAFLDGILKLDWSKQWDLSPFLISRGPKIVATLRLTGAYPTDHFAIPVEQWTDERVTEAAGSVDYRPPVEGDGSRFLVAGSLATGFGGGRTLTRTAAHGYSRAELTATRVQFILPKRTALVIRAFGGWSEKTPLQRAIFASTEDPFSTFGDNNWRPRDALFKREGVNIIPLGGAGLRGYAPQVALEKVVSGSGELTQFLHSFGDESSKPQLWVSAFGDAGFASSTHTTLDGAFLADAGVGASLRGKLYDRDVRLRLDFPLIVQQPALAGGRGIGPTGNIAFRFVFSFRDFW